MPASGDEELATIEIQRVADSVHAIVRGEVDMSNATDIEARLRSACDGAGGLVLDLSQLSFLDSHGVAAIFELHRELAAHHLSFEVIAGPDTVAGRVFELISLTQILPMRNPQAAHE